MREQSYNIFRQRLHQAAQTKALPLRVMFELTYRCNFKCRHCYVPNSYRRKKELKTKELFSILEQLKDLGCFYLGFTGGEPFIRKDILDILWYAKRKGFEIIIYTNGSLIDQNTADALRYLAPNKVDITIPAMSEQAFARITGMTGAHRRVFNAIDLLHKRKVNLGFKTCVLKENEDEIEDIHKFTYSLDAAHRLDDLLTPRLDGSQQPYKYRGLLSANNHESKETVRECSNQDSSFKLRAVGENSRLFKCGVGVSQVAITPSGELKMCLMIDYPKYKILAGSGPQTATQKSGLNNAWEKLKQQVAAIKPNRYYTCNTCALEPHCKWCPARGWLYKKNFAMCDPECRQTARSRIQGVEVCAR